MWGALLEKQRPQLSTWGACLGYNMWSTMHMQQHDQHTDIKTSGHFLQLACETKEAKNSLFGGWLCPLIRKRRMGCRKGPSPMQSSHVLHVVMCYSMSSFFCQDLMALAATACNSYLWGVACSRGQSEGKQHIYLALINPRGLPA